MTFLSTTTATTTTTTKTTTTAKVLKSFSIQSNDQDESQLSKIKTVQTQRFDFPKSALTCFKTDKKPTNLKITVVGIQVDFFQFLARTPSSRQMQTKTPAVAIFVKVG